MFKTYRRVIRFTISIVCLFSLASLVKFDFHNFNQKTYSQSPHSQEKINQTLTTQAPFKSSSSPWCKGEECTTGSWQPRQPPFKSLDDLRSVYTLANPDWFWTCYPPPGETRTDKEASIAAVRRQVDGANWVWLPDVGKLKDWDAEEFIIRMLRSPGGLILIGDSVTGQHSDVIEHALDAAHIMTDANLPHLPLHNHKNVHQRTLRKDDTLTLRLLKQAGVPSSRLDRPILTMLEEHMLIDERDIREITGELGAPAEYPWTHDFQRVDGWEEFVRNAAMPRLGEETSVTEDTVVLLNAGAHWSRHSLSMLPDRSTVKEEQETLTEAFTQMVSLVMSRITPIEQLSIYYRATSPGHPVCEVHSEPYPNITVASLSEEDVPGRLASMKDVSTDDERRQVSRWDWDLFSAHNDAWRRAVMRTMRYRRQSGKGARAFFLDMWDLALQRPDAHTLSKAPMGFDCLHWCQPLVLSQWTYQLNHMVLWDSETRMR